MIDPALLRRVPGCEDGAPALAITPLPDGGRRNRVLRIDTPRGSFVLRQRPAPDAEQPGASALDELAAHRCAASAGIAPTVLAAAEDGHWLLMHHVAGAVWDRSQLAQPARLAALLGRLQRLHALPPPAITPYDPVRILEGQRRLVPAAVGAADLAEAARLWGPFAAEERVLNHGDLSVANLVGEDPVLVDWEYAQLAPRGYDLACLLTYYPELAGLIPPAHGAGEGDTAARGRVARLQALFALLDAVWTRVHAAGFTPPRSAEWRQYPVPGAKDM
jgi:aminoglycoside phosphotransferase (APT) family kinase protein